MLDPDRVAAVRVGPAGDVAGGENVGMAGLQPRIDGDAAVELEPGCFRKRNARLDADADDDEIRLDLLSAFEAHPTLVHARDLGAEVKAHALVGVGLHHEIGELPP